MATAKTSYEAIENFKNALNCIPILKGLIDWYHCDLYGSFARYMFECREVGQDQVDEFLTRGDIDVKVRIKQCHTAFKMYENLFNYLLNNNCIVEFAGQVYPIDPEYGKSELQLDTQEPIWHKWRYGNYFVWVPYYGNKYIKIDLCIYTQSVDPIEYYDFTVNNFVFYRCVGPKTEFKYGCELGKEYKSTTMEDMTNRNIVPFMHKKATEYSLVKRLFRATKLWRLGYRIRTEEAKQEFKFMYEKGKNYKGPIYLYRTLHFCPSLPPTDEKEVYPTRYEKDKITIKDIEEMPEFQEILASLN